MRLVVFDLDGTLLDSRRDLADAANAMVRELGGQPLPEEAIGDMVGEGAALLVQRALAAAGLSPDTRGALDRFLSLYDERLLAHTMPYRGVMETLLRLTGRYSLAVLTNKPSAATERILAGLGLSQFFDRVIGGDTPLGRKPSPSALLSLVAAATASAQSTLLVGDSRIDLATARAAGTKICLARYGFGYRFEPGDFDGSEQFIDRMTELPELLDRTA